MSLPKNLDTICYNCLWCFLYKLMPLILYIELNILKNLTFNKLLLLSLMSLLLSLLIIIFSTKTYVPLLIQFLCLDLLRKSLKYILVILCKWQCNAVQKNTSRNLPMSLTVTKRKNESFVSIASKLPHENMN